MSTTPRISVARIARASEQIDPAFLDTPQFLAESLSAQLGCRLVSLGFITRSSQNGDALFSELTGCFQANAFVGASNQCNFFAAHIVREWFSLIVESKELLIKL